MAAAHVEGVQQVPPMQTWPPGHCAPQLTVLPQAFCARPQVAVPQDGAGHVTHAPPPEQVVPLGQAPQRMLPLPQAFGTVPHRAPPSAVVHSGGGGAQTPPVHCCPVGQEHLIVLPQPSATVPQRVVVESGLQVRGPQAPPASTVTWGPHVLLMHACPALHPPQSTGTPHESTAMTPQRFAQLCA
jgi:hypothetical protein